MAAHGWNGWRAAVCQCWGWNMDSSGDSVMTPQHPLTVTLEAQAWEQVFRILAKSPYEVMAPLIHAMQQQCMTQSACSAHQRRR